MRQIATLLRHAGYGQYQSHRRDIATYSRHSTKERAPHGRLASTFRPNLRHQGAISKSRSRRVACDKFATFWVFELRNSDMEPILRLLCDAVWRTLIKLMQPRHSSLYCVTGKTTVLHAAETIGVNRSTIYRWIARKKLTQDDNGLVDIDQAYALKKSPAFRAQIWKGASGLRDRSK